MRFARQRNGPFFHGHLVLFNFPCLARRAGLHNLRKPGSWHYCTRVWREGWIEPPQGEHSQFISSRFPVISSIIAVPVILCLTVQQHPNRCLSANRSSFSNAGSMTCSPAGSHGFRSSHPQGTDRACPALAFFGAAALNRTRASDFLLSGLNYPTWPRAALYPKPNQRFTGVL